MDVCTNRTLEISCRGICLVTPEQVQIFFIHEIFFCQASLGASTASCSLSAFWFWYLEHDIRILPLYCFLLTQHSETFELLFLILLSAEISFNCHCFLICEYTTSICWNPGRIGKHEEFLLFVVRDRDLFQVGEYFLQYC